MKGEQDMKRFLFGSEVHDAACRIILRENSMGENIGLSFRREPSFFPAEKISSEWSQLVVLEDDEVQKIVGFGVRSGRLYWYRGKKIELGYISQLRLLPEYRGGRILFDGYKKFKELHEGDRKVPFYLTTILSDNATTRSLLESGRAGLPTYQPIAQLSSYFFLAHKAKKGCGDVHEVSVEEVLFSYNNHVSTSYLATCYGDDTHSWLSLVDYEAVSIEGDTFSAKAILVNFSRVKQIVVTNYSGTYKAITLVVRFLSSALGITPPPVVGSELSCLYPIAISLEGDTEKGFQVLLNLAREKALDKKLHGVVCGLNSNSPLAVHANKKSLSNTRSILYAVAWDKNQLPTLDTLYSDINVEVGTL